MFLADLGKPDLLETLLGPFCLTQVAVPGVVAVPVLDNAEGVYDGALDAYDFQAILIAIAITLQVMISPGSAFAVS